MLSLICFLVCFLASVIGAICGIGGGVIIKPVLDAAGVASVAAVSFLSGCTVLSMTSYSFVRNRLQKHSGVSGKTAPYLALGAAAGGLLGKQLFSLVKAMSADPDRVGAVQAFCLMLVTVGTLIYTLKKEEIRTLRVTRPSACVLIGLLLGFVSAFLGIGGGPINLVVLFFFFSMPTKQAAENSLYIIFFSQLASLLASVLGGSVPEFPLSLLWLMAAGGIAGGAAGRAVNSRLAEKTVDRLFLALMIAVILINLYNIWKFL